MIRSRVTIRDVAALAGVSHQTVSRVINHMEGVSPDTRQRVEEAIAELNYAPNAIARIMARGRTHTLACITPNFTDYTFAGLIEGAEAEARRQGYYLLTASAPDAEAVSALLDGLVSSRRTDGLMVINPFADERHTLIPENEPVVYVGARPRHELADTVALNDDAGGRLATAHLLELGHRQIAMITGLIAEDCTQDRCEGYRSSLADWQVPYDPELVIEGDWSATAGYAAIEQLLTRGKPFSAVFAQNDRMAIGAIHALRQAGISVPEMISVIGFDDIPLASYLDPPLTTLHQDLAYIGAEAARLLIRRVEQPFLPFEQVRPQATLIIRSSTQGR